MAASIAAALARIKQDPLGMIRPGVVKELCEELHYDAWRERQLDPAVTLALFVQQIIHGNTPCSEVRHMAGQSFSASAWCQARARLPLEVYQAMLTRVCDAALPRTRQPSYLWRGHRTFHIDGSTFSMPDTPELRRAFGEPQERSKGCGFPVAHLLVLFNAATGLLLDAFASPLRTGDVSQANEYLAHLDEGDILIGDDSFSGYAHIALLLQAKLHAVVPNHHLRIVDFTPERPFTKHSGKHVVAGRPRSRWIKWLGKDDQLVEWFKPLACPAWMSRQQYDALGESIVVREIRRAVRLSDARRITVTIVTTLLDPIAYPADELIELRLRRWDVESDLRHLKTTMGLDVLRCKSEAGVRKELAVYCLVYNLVRIIMLEAAQRQQVPVSRISFADTLKWMRHARPGDALPDLIINPARPNRIEPRCRKRRPKKYALMNKPRDVLQKELKTSRRNV
jgi:DDE family transposase